MLIEALFTQGGGDPAVGLALLDIDIYLSTRRRADGVVAVVWAGLNPTEEIGGGIYTRAYLTPDYRTYDYFAWAEYTGVAVLDQDWSLMAGPEASSEIVGLIWSWYSRTLTMSTASMRSLLIAPDIEVLRGDTMQVGLTGLGNIAARTKLWFTVKLDKDDTDAVSQIQIEETAGLLYIAGAAATVAGNGSLTVTDAAVGTITIEVEAVEMAKLAAVKKMHYDVQVLEGTVVTTLRRGSFLIASDVTRVVA